MEWYWDQFHPLGELLSKEDKRKLKHLRSSIPSLAYSIICNKAGLPTTFEEKDQKFKIISRRTSYKSKMEFSKRKHN